MLHSNVFICIWLLIVNADVIQIKLVHWRFTVGDALVHWCGIVHNGGELHFY